MANVENNSSITNPTVLAPGHDTRNEPADTAAALRVAGDIDAVADADVEPINLEVAAMVGAVLAAAPAIEAQMPALRALPGVRVEAIGKLRDYAQATLHWHARALVSLAPESGLAEKVGEAIAMRERILGDLEALARHGTLDITPLAELGTSIAHRRVGTELLALSSFVHERWASIEGRSMLSLAQMDAAQRLGNAIVRLCGERDALPAAIAEATRKRDKAYTLTVRAYGEARAALLFLRRDLGDADTLAPSLWAGRGGIKRRADAPVASAGGAPASSAQAQAPVLTSSLLVPANEPRG